LGIVGGESTRQFDQNRIYAIELTKAVFAFLLQLCSPKSINTKKRISMNL